MTVIVTAFCPDDGLRTAVRSLIGQTWTQLELLVIDDGSPSEYRSLLEDVAGLDPRIRLLHLEENQGTYHARNVGLDQAQGDFVTFQDSDDWSHPRRIELQVQPLLDDDSLMVTTSECVRGNSNLMLTRVGHPLQRINVSSMLFRAPSVVSRIGFIDEVRRGADDEYLKRISLVFGDVYLPMSGLGLAVVRTGNESLSGGGCEARMAPSVPLRVSGGLRALASTNSRRRSLVPAATRDQAAISQPQEAAVSLPAEQRVRPGVRG